jgi:hypothetical protein
LRARARRDYGSYFVGGHLPVFCSESPAVICIKKPAKLLALRCYDKKT